MKPLVLFPFLIFAAGAFAPADGAAIGVEALVVVVGSDGHSITIEPERAVLGVMLYHPASAYNVRPRPTRPRGGYVKLYPLGPGGLPAIPGRIYPLTGALCFSWNEAVAPKRCGRLGRPRRLLDAARHRALFHGRPTVLTGLRPGATGNLLAALEMAFDRCRSSRLARRPARCRPFVASWDGPLSTQRPSLVCLSRRGIYARGRLYPAGPATWRLARDVS
jgi:hypothetical protein